MILIGSTTDPHTGIRSRLPLIQPGGPCLKRAPCEAGILERAARSSAPDGIEEILTAVQEENDVGYAELMSDFHWRSGRRESRSQRSSDRHLLLLLQRARHSPPCQVPDGRRRA